MEEQITSHPNLIVDYIFYVTTQEKMKWLDFLESFLHEQNRSLARHKFRKEKMA